MIIDSMGQMPRGMVPTQRGICGMPEVNRDTTTLRRPGKPARGKEASMDKILEILKGIRGDIDFTKEKALIDDGLLDSFDVVGIVGELTAAYDITISIDDMVPENFNSAEAMYALVERILDED